MKRADTIAGAAMLVFFAGVLYQSVKLPMVYLTAIGPGFLPVGASAALVALSALLVATGLRRSAAEDRGIEWPDGRGIRRMAEVIGSLAAYTLLMPRLGYTISTFLFLFVLIWLLGSFRLYWSAGISLALAVCTYLVFQVWLGLSLPRGLVFP